MFRLVSRQILSAFQFVIWGGKTATEALNAALIDVAGGSLDKNDKTAILIGCGKMGGAMLTGWVKSRFIDDGIYVVELNEEATRLSRVCLI